MDAHCLPLWEAQVACEFLGVRTEEGLNLGRGPWE